jgi:hypothetical protein
MIFDDLENFPAEVFSKKLHRNCHILYVEKGQITPFLKKNVPNF